MGLNSKIHNRGRRVKNAISASLTAKILLQVFLPIVFVYLVLISYQSYVSYQECRRAAEELADCQTVTLATKVEQQLYGDMQQCIVLGQQMETLVSLPKQQRIELCNSMSAIFKEHSQHYMSVWYCWQLFTMDSQWNHEYGRYRATFADSKVGGNRVDILDKEGEAEGGLYHKMHQEGLASVTNPYFEDYEGALNVPVLESSVCVPMKDKGGNFLGLFGIDISLDSYQEMLTELWSSQDAQFSLVAPDGTIVASTTTDIKGKSMKEVSGENYEYVLKATKGDSFHTVIETEGEEHYLSMIPIRVSPSGDYWVLSAWVSYDTILKEAQSDFLKFLGIGALGLLLIALFFYQLMHKVISPVSTITEYINAMAEGDFSAQVDLSKASKDEVGQMLCSIAKMNDSIKRTMEIIQRTVDMITTTTRRIESGLSNITEQTMQQASSMEELASNIQEISSASNDNYLHTESALRITEQTKNGMNEGADKVTDANAQIQAISDYLVQIRDIANQTTILSLNASIEAARAGAAGKGFTVVAGEVNKLAEQCREVSEQIDALTQKSSRIAMDAADSISGLQPEIEETLILVKKVSENTYSQNSAVNQISSAIASLNEGTQQTAGEADNMMDIVSKLKFQANRLSEVVNTFTV